MLSPTRNNGVEIRPAHQSDEETVTSLWKACGLVVAYNDPTRDFHLARAKPNSDVLVGIDVGGQVIASVMVGHDGHRGWVYYVAVAPDRQGTGIGRSMMTAAEQWLKDRNIAKIQLMVRETNTAVVAFYEGLNFETIPRVVMQKWLK